MRTSVIVPTTCRPSLARTLRSLREQLDRPYEVILVHSCDRRSLEGVMQEPPKDLPLVPVRQTRPGFTGALNDGLNSVDSLSDLIIFTDDDSEAPPTWVRKYVEVIERLGPRYAGACSRDLLVDPETGNRVKGPDDSPLVKAYRRLLVPLLRRPHPSLKPFSRGVFVDVRYNIIHGPCIPDESCVSLPFRGVNMAFRAEAMDGVRFPEHPGLTSAVGNEQYIGVQLALRGYLYAYIPDNPVYHYHNPKARSLSRSGSRRDVEIMRELIRGLLEGPA